MKGAANISCLEKITEQEMEAILNDFDSIEVMAQYFHSDLCTLVLFLSVRFLQFKIFKTIFLSISNLSMSNVLIFIIIKKEYRTMV